MFNNTKYKLVYKISKTLCWILGDPKDKIDVLENSRNYEISCKDCDNGSVEKL